MDSEKMLTSREVHNLLGISLRRLQWADERGFVRPRREGHRRLYNPKEVETLRKYMMIVRSGRQSIRLQTAKKLLRSDFHRVEVISRARIIDGVLYLPCWERH